MNRFTELFFPLQEAEDRMGEGGLLASPCWVFLPLELASIPRRGNCPPALLGTAILWKASRLGQFYTEQLLGAAGPALLFVSEKPSGKCECTGLPYRVRVI